MSYMDEPGRDTEKLMAYTAHLRRKTQEADDRYWILSDILNDTRDFDDREAILKEMEKIGKKQDRLVRILPLVERRHEKVHREEQSIRGF
jgi:hypothetical protein